MTPDFDPYAHYAHEDAVEGLSADGAVSRLAKALSFKTVFEGDSTDWHAFDLLQEHVRASFPHIAQLGSFELVGHSVLIRIPGTKPELEGVLLLAHQDVVPVVPGTEDEWVHGAYEGVVDDEWVWGRGALDIKDMLMAELEATELLLARHGLPERSIWLAFGEDEEVASHGATAVAAELERRGVRFACSLDEGTTTFFDGADYGAPGVTLSDICLSQKGFLNVELHAPGKGGHSSNPFGGTSLQHVCQAVAALADDLPEPQLNPLVAQTFKTLAPHITEEPMKSLVADVDANSALIAHEASQVRGLYPFVCNTMAVDCLAGSSPSPNVMPGDVCATLNFRLLPGTTADDVLDWATPIVERYGVAARVAHGTPAGRTDSPEGFGYAQLKETLEHYYPETLFVPSFVCGGTDSIRYEGVVDTVMRICPFRPAPEEEARGVHGVNERISKRCYLQGIRVLLMFIEKTCYQ